MPEFRVSGDLSRGTSLAIPVRGRIGLLRWSRTPTARRYLFGYTLLAPAVVYVGLLVGVPFLFSLYVALRNTIVFTVGAGILKGLLGTALAFLLVQPFTGRKVVRALVVIPFTLPI